MIITFSVVETFNIGGSSSFSIPDIPVEVDGYIFCCSGEQTIGVAGVIFEPKDDADDTNNFLSGIIVGENSHFLFIIGSSFGTEGDTFSFGI